MKSLKSFKWFVSKLFLETFNESSINVWFYFVRCQFCLKSFFKYLKFLFKIAFTQQIFILLFNFIFINLFNFPFTLSIKTYLFFLPLFSHHILFISLYKITQLLNLQFTQILFIKIFLLKYFQVPFKALNTLKIILAT